MKVHIIAAVFVLAVTSASMAETYIASGITTCKDGFSPVYTGKAQSEVTASVVSCSGAMGECPVTPGGASVYGCAPAGKGSNAPSLAVPCALCKRD